MNKYFLKKKDKSRKEEEVGKKWHICGIFKGCLLCQNLRSFDIHGNIHGVLNRIFAMFMSKFAGNKSKKIGQFLIRKKTRTL